MEPELTGGTIATMIAAPLGALLAAALGIVMFFTWRRLRAKHSDDTPFALGAAILSCISLLAIVVGTWWGMYPWKSEYHHWTPISGLVDTVDSRLVSIGEKSMEDKFVVKFVGGDAQYGVLDTRAAGLKPGDRLTITCVRIYQWAGTHGYDCNFVSLERAK